MLKDRSAPREAERGGRLRRLGALLARAATIAGLIVSPGFGSAQPVPPDDDYRTLETVHFRVTFPSGMEDLGRKAAMSAERAHAALTASFLQPPSGTIDLLVTDHSDFSNGTADVFPSNRIVVWAQPPLDGLALSHFDEWIEIVITHELVHVFHLDRSGPIGRGVRSVLGRVPWTWPAYPGYASSFMGIEGIAVHRESVHTSAGRVHGSFHDAIVRTQAVEGRSESLDQALGRSPVWPANDRPYVFGSLFFRYLSDTYGEPALVGFLEAIADQWIPYRLDAAARDAFGASFQDLWNEWTAQVRIRAEALNRRIEAEKILPEPERLTEGGRWALHPTPGPSGEGVVYVRADGRSDVRLVLWTRNGERTLTRWNSLERPRWKADGSLLLPQAEYFDTYRVYKDLFHVGLDGTATRLTRGMRVVHADPHPRSSRIAAVQAVGGLTRVVLLSAEGSVEAVIREAEEGVLWSHPAWSPDGRTLALVRRRPGGWTAILLLDVESGRILQVTEDRSLNSSPTWSPDGGILVWASDRSGVPNLYAARVEGGANRVDGRAMDRTVPTQFWQVTDLSTAGTFPAIDPSGDWLYLSVLSDDGWEVARVPFDPDGWMAPLPIDPRYEGDPSPGEGPEDVELEIGEARRYSALRTLLPRYWLPTRVEAETVLGTKVLPDAWGARTSGSDLVGRHEYDLWIAQSFGGGIDRSEWRAGYAWAGFGNPVLIGEAGQQWSSRSPILSTDGTMQPEASPDTLFPVFRERWVGGSLELRRQRMRSSGVISVGTRFISQRSEVLESDARPSERFRLLDPSRRLAEARLAAGLSTARSYPFSVSTENGVGVTLELRERWDRSVPDSLAGLIGADGGFRESVVSLRLYQGVPGPGYASHVVALRAAFGAAQGPGTGNGHFSVGGGGGDGRGVLGVTLGSAFRRFPVRGISAGAERGDVAWSVSGEWRFPIALAHTGLGAWPVHVDRIAGSLFADVAGTGREIAETSRRWRTVSSIGAELMVFGSLLFEEVDRVRVGIALPLESPVGGSTGPSIHLETGWSF